MYRRSLIALAAVAALVGVAACGDSDTSTPATEPPPDETLPPPPTDPSDSGPGNGAYEHPTGADEVVIRIGYEGGFVTPEMTFQELPTLLVSGDGRMFQQGPVILIYPGPLLPNTQVRSVSEDGIQQLLALADEHGLLEEREYDAPTQIADAPDTVVEITVGGETYVHRAYALGMGEGPDGTESDEARAELLRFVEAALAFATAPADDVVGPEESFEPEHYLIRALLVGDADFGADDGIEPRVVDWPADVSVRLDDEIECAEIPAGEVHDLFADADQLTWFAEDGITYQVVVKPQLPGDSC